MSPELVTLRHFRVQGLDWVGDCLGVQREVGGGWAGLRFLLQILY